VFFLQFVLHVVMSHLKLTKIVTILPYFVIVNCTPNQLRYMEDNQQTDLWFDLAPQQVLCHRLSKINRAVAWPTSRYVGLLVLILLLDR
jgi:SHR-binding domain of vacuolar-sorting associated protein 13